MKFSAPKWLPNVSHVFCVVRKLRPNVDIDSFAPWMSLTAMTTTVSAAAPATTWMIRSPKRTRRPEKGRRVVSVGVSSVLNVPLGILTYSYYLRLDLLDLRLVERDDLPRERDEVVLRRKL